MLIAIIMAGLRVGRFASYRRLNTGYAADCLVQAASSIIRPSNHHGRNMQQMNRARQLATSVLSKIENRVGAGAPLHIQTMRDMAEAYRQAEQSADAYEMLTMAVLHAKRPVEHLLAAMEQGQSISPTMSEKASILLLAEVMADQAEVAPDAEQVGILEPALVYGQAADQSAPEVSSVAFRLGGVYARQGDHDRAAGMYRLVLQMKCSPNRRATTDMLLAKSLEVLGNVSEAAGLAREALKLWEAALGLNSPGVLPALAMLARLDGGRSYKDRMTAIMQK